MSATETIGLLAEQRRLRAREISAVELLEGRLRRIEAVNGGPPSFDGAPEAINAWARLYRERALAQASAADRRLDRDGDAAPPLCGIPLGLKDLFAVEGLPLTASSRVLDDHRAARTSAIWARLERDGAVLVGHTHTHEFAAGGTTDQVGNPWSVRHSPGGSSGGSAAAVASAMVSAALGTDTAGSLRIPAALCGVSSFKPTYGRLSMRGVIPLAPTLDHAGPIAGTIADCMPLLQAAAGAGEQGGLPLAPPAPIGALPTTARPGPRPLAGTRIAITDRAEAAGLHADVADGVEAAIAACRALGAELVPLAGVPEFDGGDYNRIFVPEAVACHAPYRALADRYRPSVRELLEQAPAAAEVEDYLGAQRRRAQVTAAWDRLLAERRIDAILEPTTAVPAPERGGGYERGNAGGDGDPLIVLTAIWNVTGAPVAALPAAVGRRSGLPVGVSLIGHRGGEGAVAQIAIDLQAHALPGRLN